MFWAELTKSGSIALHEEEVIAKDKFGHGLWDAFKHEGKIFAIKKIIPVPGDPIFHETIEEFAERMENMILLHSIFKLCPNKQELSIAMRLHSDANGLNDYEDYKVFSKNKKSILEADMTYMAKERLKDIAKEPKEKKPHKVPSITNLLIMFNNGDFRKKKEPEQKMTRRLSA
jgi:hypothetical protein